MLSSCSVVSSYDRSADLLKQVSLNSCFLPNPRVDVFSFSQTLRSVLFDGLELTEESIYHTMDAVFVSQLSFP